MYIQPQTADLQHLSTAVIETSDCIEYRDVLRVTVEDGSEHQFKAGQEQGGNFKCLCGVEVKEHRNISHSFSRPHISIQEKQNIMLKAFF